MSGPIFDRRQRAGGDGWECMVGKVIFDGHVFCACVSGRMVWMVWFGRGKGALVYRLGEGRLGLVFE